MIVSLDDQLEWQESSKSHSPRTPTAPEALQSLRMNSPSPAPSQGMKGMLSPQELDELSTMSGIEVLERMRDYDMLVSASVRGDYLCFRDGQAFPLQLLLPLQINPVKPSMDSDGKDQESVLEPLTVGSAWLSVIAEHSYESQLASLLRSRKNLSELELDDRRILNRYMKGSLSLVGLKASKLWTGVVSTEEREAGLEELAMECDDSISIRLRKKLQLSVLQERRNILSDQQNRLRRLLARELQRQHASKVVTPTQSVPQTSSTAVLTNAVSDASNPTVSSAVSNMLKKFASKAQSQGIPPTETRFSEDESKVDPQSMKIHSDINDLSLHVKLRSLQIEWYRVGLRLRTATETEEVLTRKIKRLRYARH